MAPKCECSVTGAWPPHVRISQFRAPNKLSFPLKKKGHVEAKLHLFALQSTRDKNKSDIVIQATVSWLGRFCRAGRLQASLQSVSLSSGDGCHYLANQIALYFGNGSAGSSTGQRVVRWGRSPARITMLKKAHRKPLSFLTASPVIVILPDRARSTEHHHRERAGWFLDDVLYPT